jgi:hypothetical protein
MKNSQKKHQQLGFEILEKSAIKKIFGGSLLRSNPKTKRPVTTKRSMHTVLGSKLAVGRRSMLLFQVQISRQIYKQAEDFGVKIYGFANGGDHLHLVLLPRSRAAFNGFIRAISGIIARIVTGAERGRGKALKFWDARPFTRVVEWGRDLRNVCAYLRQNTLEALGFIAYKPRKSPGGYKLAVGRPHRLSTA